MSEVCNTVFDDAKNINEKYLLDSTFNLSRSKNSLGSQSRIKLLVYMLWNACE